MNLPVPLGALVASVLLAAAAEPDSLAAQRVEPSTTATHIPRSGHKGQTRVSGSGRLTAAQIAQTSAHNAYEVISRIRPQWLRRRGVSSNAVQGGIRIYLDGLRVGGVEELRRIDTNLIDSVQYLNGVEATLRFGTGNGDGAILVNTRG